MTVKSEILRLKAEGMSNKAIAVRLECSPSTVTYHCNAEYRQRHIANKIKRCRENKVKAVAEMGGKCVKCDYDRCIDALEFHHVDLKKEKRFVRHALSKFSYERIKSELKKCILVCCRCHREIHAGLKK